MKSQVYECVHIMIFKIHIFRVRSVPFFARDILVTFVEVDAGEVKYEESEVLLEVELQNRYQTKGSPLGISYTRG